MIVGLPMEAQVRPVTPDDLPALTTFLHTNSILLQGQEVLQEERLKESLSSGKLTLEADTWLVTNKEGKMLGYTWFELLKDWVVIPSIYQALEISDQSVGLYLQSCLEQRLLELLPEGIQGTFLAYVMGEKPVQRDFLAQSGYTRSITFSQMEIEFREPPQAPIWPATITVRQFDPDKDLQATYRADEESAEDKGYHLPLSLADWRYRVRLPLADPTLCFLACDGDEIAGIALNYVKDEQVGVIDHLGVRRAWRRQGLGMALLRHSFQAFYQRGLRKAVLNVDADSLTHADKLYKRAGMQIIDQYHIYKKVLEEIPLS